MNSLVNDFFDEVYIINLKHRKDRLIKSVQTLKKFGISAKIVEAVNGYSLPHIDDYHSYTEIPIGLDGCHHFERSYKRKMIGSPGAWGYLKTWENILLDAKKNGHRSFLSFDDDIIFHKQFEERFRSFVSNIPSYWKCIYLGASQHSWNIGSSIYLPSACKSLESSAYYHPNYTDGSFAVGIHASAYDTLLEATQKMNCAFDSGPLRDLNKSFPKQCYVVYPNIVIADVSDSDIGNSRHQVEHSRKMKWDLASMDKDIAYERISVVMPIYNAESTIEASIKSIQNQTYPNVEIVAVDDTSTDKTYEILKRLAKKDPNIHLIQNPTNSGCYRSRNTGIKHASGSIIAIQDADDISLSDRLMNQAAPIVTGAAKFTLSEIYRSRCTISELEALISDDKQLLDLVLSRRKLDDRNRYGYYDKPILGFMTSVYSKELFEEFGLFYDARFAADMEFFERILYHHSGLIFDESLNAHSYLWKHKKITGLYELVDGINLVSSSMNISNITNSYRKEELLALKKEWRKLFSDSASSNQYDNLANNETNNYKSIYHRINSAANIEKSKPQTTPPNSNNLQKKITTLEKKISLLDKRISQKEERINDLLRSKSWRYTQWIRDLIKPLI